MPIKQWFRRFAGLALVFTFTLLYAAQIYAAPEDPLPLSDFLMQLWNLLGGIKGASTLVIAWVVTQAVMMFFRTELAAFAGKYKLAIVLGLNVTVTVLGHMVAGLPVMAAVLNAGTIAALQVFVNELLKHAKEGAPKPLAVK